MSGICKTMAKWFLVWGTLTDILGDEFMVLRMCMVHMELAKEVLRKEDYSSFVTKRSCVWQTHGLKRRSRKKITYGMNGNKTEIDFVLVVKNNKKYLKDMKAIPWELQHWLVATDIDKRKLMKVVKTNKLLEGGFGS